MANGNGEIKGRKPRGFYWEPRDENGYSRLNWGWLAQWGTVAFLSLVGGVALRVVRYEERVDNLREDVREDRQQNRLDHENFIKDDELQGRVQTLINEQRLNLVGLMSDR